MDNFTDKTSEVIKASFDKAEEMANSQVHPLHLVSILWDDPSASTSTDIKPTLLKGIIERVGGNITQFNRALLSRLNKLPIVHPTPTPPIPLTNSYHAVLREAQKLQKDQGDQFVAVDHLLLAIIHVDHTEMKDLLKASGTDVKALEAELKRKRGGRKVDSRGAESQFEALTKCQSSHLRSAQYHR
jgi:ATP-dependent Clp protease ATP-binding subunit ClpB